MDQDPRGNDLVKSSPQHDDLTPSTGRRPTSFASSVSEHNDPTSSTGRTSTFPTLSNNSDQQAKPRAIHFSPKVNIKTIPSLKAYSPGRIGKMFYSEDDLADQREEYVATAKEMCRRHRRGQDPLHVHEIKIRQECEHQPFIITSTTTRGLESMASRRTAICHRQEQRDVIGAVLLAQENNFTPEEIAILYSYRARSAKTRARNLGLADAQL